MKTFLEYWYSIGDGSKSQKNLLTFWLVLEIICILGIIFIIPIFAFINWIENLFHG